MNTTAQEVFECFESSFRDRVVLPEELELVWLKRAIARYTVELAPIAFDTDTLEFDSVLDMYVVDTLASYMRQSYQEREWSRVNKQISIVGKDISIDGAGHTKTAAKNELEYYADKSSEMTGNQKSTAYN